METASIEEQFEKDCFEPAITTWTAKLDKILRNTKEQVLIPFLEAVEDVLKNVNELVIENSPTSTETTSLSTYTVTISFLRTSLLKKKPVLLLEAYVGMPFIESPLYEKEVDASWLFPDWETFKQDMLERAKQALLTLKLGKPQMFSYESKAVTGVLQYIYYFLKYAVRAIEEKTIWNELATKLTPEKDNEFIISFGEYMDWQLPIAVKRADVDLTAYTEKTSLIYRTFTKQYYEEQSFVDLNLENDVFKECDFYQCSFQKVNLRDSRFINCIFEQCTFEQCEFMGSSILNSKLIQVSFKQCTFQAGWYADGEAVFMYAAGQLKRCTLTKVIFEETDTTDKTFVRCFIEDEPKEEGI